MAEFDYYLSYGLDFSYGGQLVNYLREKGKRIFGVDGKFPPYTSYDDSIRVLCIYSEYIIILGTKDNLASPHTCAIIDTALALKSKIIPILLDDVEINSRWKQYLSGMKCFYASTDDPHFINTIYTIILKSEQMFAKNNHASEKHIC